MTYAAIEPSTPEEPSTLSDYTLPGAIVLVFLWLVVNDCLHVIVERWDRKVS